MLQETRKITTFNNIGNTKKVIDSKASVLGELLSDFDENGISYRNMKLITGETQVTLESKQSILPDGDFILFLVPEKVKSGINTTGGFNIPDNDEYMIDKEEGITHNEYSWENDDHSVEDYDFKSYKDLAIARSKKAGYYLDKVVEYLTSEGHRGNTDPEIRQLAATAEQIKANLGLFD